MELVLDYKELSREEEIIVATKAKDGNANAAKRLVMSIYPLIRREAIRVAKSSKLEVAELISEGVIAAYKTIPQYDPTSGFRFGTLAIGKFGNVKQGMNEAKRNAHLIPLPADKTGKGESNSFIGFDANVGDGKMTVSETIPAPETTEYPISDSELMDMIGRVQNVRMRDMLTDMYNGMTARQAAKLNETNRMRITRDRAKAIAMLKKMIVTELNRKV